MHIVAAAVAAILTAGSDGDQVVSIRDPGNGAEAYIVTVPAGWHVQGTLFHGTGCDQTPFGAFRATSQDGLTALELLPRLDWRWGTFMGQRPAPGCLPLSEELTPADLLRHLARLMQFEYAGPVPLSPKLAESQRRENARSDEQSERYSRRSPGTDAWHQESAQAKVRYQNGTFPMEALLTGTILYHRHTRPLGGQTVFNETCSATVRIVRAQQGKLDAAVQRLERADAAWNRRWWDDQVALAHARDVEGAQRIARQYAADMELQQRQHDELIATMNRNQRVHEEEIAVMNRGSDLNLARQQDIWAKNRAVASDWIDTSLGQQTVLDPKTGQVSKVPAGFGFTWVDETGKSAIVTHDPNVNPNGYRPGTWTLQQHVHGDGSSR